MRANEGGGVCSGNSQRSITRYIARNAVENDLGINVNFFHLDRRAHNPVIAQAQLDHDAAPVPWLHGRRIRLDFK